MASPGASPGGGARGTGVVVMGLGRECDSCSCCEVVMSEGRSLVCCRDTLHPFCWVDGVGEFGTPEIQDGFEIASQTFCLARYLDFRETISL